MNNNHQNLIVDQEQLQAHLKAYCQAKLKQQNPRDIYADFMALLDQTLVETTLQHTYGNQSKAARILGMNRGTFRTKLKQIGLIS